MPFHKTLSLEVAFPLPDLPDIPTKPPTVVEFLDFPTPALMERDQEILDLIHRSSPDNVPRFGLEDLPSFLRLLDSKVPGVTLSVLPFIVNYSRNAVSRLVLGDSCETIATIARLLESQPPKIVIHAAYILANLAVDPDSRTKIGCSPGTIAAVVSLWSHGDIKLQKIAGSLLTNLSVDQLSRSILARLDVIPKFTKLLRATTPGIIIFAASILANLAAEEVSGIKTTPDPEGITLLVDLLRNPDPLVVKSAVRALMNIAARSDSRADIANSPGAITELSRFPTWTDLVAKEEAILALTNLAIDPNIRKKIGIQLPLIRALQDHMKGPAPTLIGPALLLLGALAFDPDIRFVIKQTHVVLETTVSYLNHQEPTIRRAAIKTFLDYVEYPLIFDEIDNLDSPIPKIVALLTDSNHKTVEYAALSLSLLSRNLDFAIKISNAGGISALVLGLSGSSKEICTTTLVALTAHLSLQISLADELTKNVPRDVFMVGFELLAKTNARVLELKLAEETSKRPHSSKGRHLINIKPQHKKDDKPSDASAPIVHKWSRTDEEILRRVVEIYIQISRQN